MASVYGHTPAGKTIPALTGGGSGTAYVPPATPPHMPDLSMEMAFTQQFAAGPPWTDVSSYLQLQNGITWSRGRNDPLSLTQPGTSSWMLENDGRFTPNRVESPYYPNVKINRGARLSATWNGILYRMFTHYTDPLETAFEGGIRSITPMTATDRTKLLSHKRLGSIYLEEVKVDGPAAVYMLGESSGGSSSINNLGENSQGWADIINVYDDAGNLHSYGEPGPFPDGSSALKLGSNADGIGAAINFLPAFVAFPFTVEMWVKIPAVGNVWDAANAGCLWSMQGPIGAAYNGASISQRKSDQLLQIQFAQAASTGTPPSDVTYATGLSNQSYSDDQWHHVVGVFNADDALLMVDGVNVAHAISNATHIAYTASATSYSWGSVARSTTGPPSYITATFAGIAFYPGIALSPERAAQHWATGATFGIGDFPGTRIHRFLAYSLTPLSARSYTYYLPEDVDFGNSQLELQNTQGVSAWDAVSTAAQAEQGLLWVNSNGTVEFRSRRSFLLPPVAFTVPASQIGTDFTIVTDDTLLINECTVNQKNSSPYTARDYQSQDDYGIYSDNLPDVPLNNDDKIYFTHYRVSRYSVPAPRTYTAKITPSVDTALFPAILACEPGQRFTITGLLAPMPSSLDLIVQSVSHSVTPDRWMATIVGAPTDYVKYAGWDNFNWDSGAQWAW
jgi:hypothetical protein